jgi:hypothetical protein
LKRYKNHTEVRVRERYLREAENLGGTYAAAVWAMRKWYRKNDAMYAKVDAVLQNIYKEFGWKTRALAPLMGRIVHFTTLREARRLAKGWTYEPATHCDKNIHMLRLERALDADRAKLPSEPVKWVSHEIVVTD